MALGSGSARGRRLFEVSRRCKGLRICAITGISWIQTMTLGLLPRSETPILFRVGSGPNYLLSILFRSPAHSRTRLDLNLGELDSEFAQEQKS